MSRNKQIVDPIVEDEQESSGGGLRGGHYNSPAGAISGQTKFTLAADEYDKMESVIQKLGGTSGRVRLMRLSPKDHVFKTLEWIPIDQFSEEYLIRKWGGGDYIACFHDSDDKMVAKVPLGIDESVTAYGAASKAQSVTTPSGGIDLKALQELVSNDGNIMVKMLEQTTQRQQDQMNMFLTMMMESQKSTMQAIAQMSGGRSQGEPASRLLESMMPLLLANLTGGNKQDNGIFKSIDDLRKARDLFDDMRGGDDKEGLFEKLIPLLGPVAQGLMRPTMALPAPAPAPKNGAPQHGPRPQQPAPQQHNPQPRPSMPPQQQQQVDPVEVVIQQIRQGVPFLVEAASKGNPPQIYADMLLDRADDSVQDVLVHLLDRDDWQQKVFADDPRIDQFPEWFNELRENILDQLTEHEQQAEHNRGADAANAGANPSQSNPG